MVLPACLSRVSSVLFAFCIIALPALADEIASPREFANSRVFRIKAGKRIGSAVLVALEGKVGYFATCYHVLHGAENFEIYTFDRRLVTDEKSEAYMLRRWDRDLVVVRARVNPELQLNPVDLEHVVAVTGPNDNFPDGYALGFPGDTRDLWDMRVRIRGTPKSVQQFIQPDAPAPSGIDVDIESFSVRFLTEEFTLPGMSGGLVVDRQGHFGGLIFGQTERGICLMLPAEEIVKVVNQAQALGGKTLVPFDPALCTVPPPFKIETLAYLVDGAPDKEQLAEIDVLRKQIQILYDKLSTERENTNELNKRSAELAQGIQRVVGNIEALAEAGNPEMQRLCSKLDTLLTRFNGPGDLMEIRLAKATLANAQGRYEEPLSLFTAEDELTEEKQTEALIERLIAVLRIRGDALSGLERHEAALECYEKALRYRPNSVCLSIAVAKSLSHLDRQEEAIAKLNPIIERLKKNVIDDTTCGTLTLCLIQRAVAQNGLNELEKALSDVEEAQQINEKLIANIPATSPGDLADALFVKTVVLDRLERHEDALEAVVRAKAIWVNMLPNEQPAHEYKVLLALSAEANQLILLERYGEALENYKMLEREGLRLASAGPLSSEYVRLSLHGSALWGVTHAQRAMKYLKDDSYDDALKDLNEAEVALANALQEMRKLQPNPADKETREEYAGALDMVLQLKALALCGRGDQRFEKGEKGQAIDDKREAERILNGVQSPPSDLLERIWFSLLTQHAIRALELEEKGEVRDAIEDYNRAADAGEKLLKKGRDPDYVKGTRSFLPAPLVRYALLLAATAEDNLRDGARALRVAKWAHELAPDDEQVLEALAAAHAEVSDFKNAVLWQEKARDIAPEGKKGPYQRILNLYQKMMPYRLPKKLD